jgi:hypothetical protein
MTQKQKHEGHEGLTKLLMGILRETFVSFVVKGFDLENS